MGDSIRNIERIEESEDARRVPRGVSVALVVLGGACLLFAGAALGGRTSGPEKKSDPLGDLLAERSRASLATAGVAAPGATELSPHDVTFPRMLSDDDHPPTALAAVRPASHGTAGPAAPGAAAPSVAQPEPPPATDRLPVVPLPAQTVLEATTVLTHPRDALARAATSAAKMETSATGEAAPAGHEGGYQLQVSSFHTQAEAQSFAEQLRARGHRAYVVEATVPGRGTWYRVRIGPFGTHNAAAEYRASFEDREHVVPFIVTPETTAKAR